MAIFRRHYDVARLLLEKGANIDQPGRNPDGPLIFSAARDLNEATVRFLLGNGADVNFRFVDKLPGYGALEQLYQVTPLHAFACL